VHFWTDHCIAPCCAIKTTPWSCKTDKYWPTYTQNKSGKEFFWIWLIIASYFPPTPRVKTHRLNVWKTSCKFVYFNSWQIVDGLIFVVKYGHHSWAYPEGQTKFWSSSVYISPPYSIYCTWKSIRLTSNPCYTLVIFFTDCSTSHRRCVYAQPQYNRSQHPCSVELSMLDLNYHNY